MSLSRCRILSRHSHNLFVIVFLPFHTEIRKKNVDSSVKQLIVIYVGHPRFKSKVVSFPVIIITTIAQAQCFRPGVTKLRPAGQIRPAKPFHPALVDILPMRKNNITKENLLIWQKHFLKQSHFVRCPALGLLSNSLCDPRTIKFGDPCSRARGT